MSKNPHPPVAVLITGAWSGIGEALARDYAGPGRILALSRRDAEHLETVAKTYRKFGSQVNAETVDVAERDAMAR
jgi:NADP-dependent 3-hydroxy acid dehydrogenase YdfG